MEMGGLRVTPSLQYNPLDEPSPLGLRLKKSQSFLELIQTKLSQASPLGLRLKKSQSFLELIQTKLSQASAPPVGGPLPTVSSSSRNKALRLSSASRNRLKASSFHGTLLRIGTWEYESKHEADLVAKCYYVTRKLVWEVLDGSLKRKIEIRWSDIVDLKRTIEDFNTPESLTIVLERRPIFFREVDSSQPARHTLWEAATDFTGGQATIHRQHYLECPRGSIGRHFEKMVQCDPHMLFLSQQKQLTLDSMCFEDQNCVDPIGNHSGSFSHETLSSSSSSDGETSNNKFEELKELGNWDSIMVPGMHPSTSMSDLVIHLEGRISEQGMPTNPTFSSEEWQNLEILDNINRCLFSDVQNLPEPDEKSLLSRVNSLCRLLQNDDNNPTSECEVKSKESFGALLSDELLGDELLGDENLKNDGGEGRLNMSREDSDGDLLLYLPRVASLPQILSNISEDGK